MHTLLDEHRSEMLRHHLQLRVPAGTGRWQWRMLVLLFLRLLLLLLETARVVSRAGSWARRLHTYAIE